MEIICDCNNDLITIQDGKANISFDWRKKIGPSGVAKLLEEIFNKLGSLDGSPYIDVKLIKIDEDTSTTIGEW